MEEPQKHYAKWNIPDKIEQWLYDSIHKNYPLLETSEEMIRN